MRSSFFALSSSAAVVFLGALAWVGCGGSDATLARTGGDADGSPEGAASSDGSTSNGDDGSSATDGSNGGETDAGAGDGRPGGDQKSLPCGTMTCALPAQVCCLFGRGGGASTKVECAADNCSTLFDDGGFDAGPLNGDGGVNLTQLKCTGQANCAVGSICCVHPVSAGANDVLVSECLVGATCANAGKSAQLCDPRVAVTGCPASGQLSMCSSTNIGDWGLAPPFATCGGIGH